MRIGNAQTQYTDVFGTAAADMADSRKAFAEAAAKNGMDLNRYHPVAYSFYGGADTRGRPMVSVYAIDRTASGAAFEEWKQNATKRGGVLPVQQFRFEVTADQFFEWFKRFHSRVIPFGSRLAVDGESLIPEPREQAALALIRKAHADGLSLRETQALLTAKGHRGRDGRAVGLKVVRRAVASPAATSAA